MSSLSLQTKHMIKLKKGGGGSGQWTIVIMSKITTCLSCMVRSSNVIAYAYFMIMIV